MVEDLGWTEAQTTGVNTAVAVGLTAVAGWPSGRIGGPGVVLLVLVRSLAGLVYAERAINATYLDELVAQAHADPVSLASGAGWGTSAFIGGCVPILLSGLVILRVTERRSEGRPLRPTLAPYRAVGPMDPQILRISGAGPLRAL